MISFKKILNTLRLYWPYILAALMVYLSLVNDQHLKLLSRAEHTMHLLLETRARIEQFRAANEKFPRSASEMGLAASYDIDPITEEPFQWASDETWTQLEKTGVQLDKHTGRPGESKVYPLVWQASSFRIPFWPWGQKRQYALLSDWSIRDILAEDKE